MTISFLSFFEQVISNPVLAITVLLTLAVILVNGWTDAPNAIATCVSTRAIGVRKAIIMAAVFNFLGVFVMTMINASVAATIYNMVDFGGNSREALIALCAALFAIVSWATAAWWFGIPTSESHALIAGISGAAIALHSGLDGINGAEWIKVIYGLVLSTILGFAFGWICSKVINTICKIWIEIRLRDFRRSSDCRRSHHGIYARCSGRTEVYGSVHARSFPSQRTEQC